ncbi:MAG: 4Fe-4S dicluster domain-containing protein [Candidatus Omnitrophota bacterium]
MSDQLTVEIIRGNFEPEIEKASQQKFADCYQCGKCSAGCPMVGYMDIMPSQIMRMVQVGQREKALGCRTIWLCASCETCTTRCPKDIDIARVMDTLREISLKSGRVHPDAGDITVFHRVFLKMIELTGRLFEAGVVGAYKFLRPGHVFDDMAAGIKMGVQGKLSPLPHSIKNKKEIKRIFKICMERKD